MTDHTKTSQLSIQPADHDFDEPSEPVSQLRIQPSKQEFDDIEDHRLAHTPIPSLIITDLATEPEHPQPWYAQIWLWLLITGTMALFGGIAFDLIDKYLNAYEKTPVLSIVLLSSNAIFIGVLLWLLIRESLAYWRISSLVTDYPSFSAIAQRANKDEITELLDRLDQRSENHPLCSQLHHRFWASIQAHHTGQERLTIYRTLVATPLREEAEKRIQPAVLQGAGLSLISPSSTIHTMILLWRSAKLVQDIAHIYGLRPGFFGTIKLLKVALENAILQQGADMIIDAGVSKLSQGVLSLVAEKGAEATVTGLLIRRIAKATIDELDVTRPA